MAYVPPQPSRLTMALPFTLGGGGGAPGGGGVIQPPTGGIGGIAGAACGLLPSGPARDLCNAAAGLLPGGGAAGGGNATNTGQNLDPTATCPAGTVWDGSQCVTPGATGTIQRTLPGGQTGTLADQYGNAVMGRYGAALVPRQVGTTTRRDRVTGSEVSVPLLRCPPGAVLGKDNLCYDHIANKDRKWPSHRPPITRGQMKAITRAHQARKAIERAALKAGAKKGDVRGLF